MIYATEVGKKGVLKLNILTTHFCTDHFTKADILLVQTITTADLVASSIACKSFFRGIEINIGIPPPAA